MTGVRHLTSWLSITGSYYKVCVANQHRNGHVLWSISIQTKAASADGSLCDVSSWHSAFPSPFTPKGAFSMGGMWVLADEFSGLYSQHLHCIHATQSIHSVVVTMLAHRRQEHISKFNVIYRSLPCLLSPESHFVNNIHIARHRRKMPPKSNKYILPR